MIEYSVRSDLYGAMLGSWVIVAIGSTRSITLILILTSQGLKALYKQINDNLGHEIGDEVLAAIAKLFKKAIRNIDTPARVGGNEFLFILPNLQSSSEALEVVNRLTTRLSSLTSIRGYDLSVGASAGIAIYPDDALSASKLRSFADQAMYSAKQDNVQVKFYNDLIQPVLSGL